MFTPALLSQIYFHAAYTAALEERLEKIFITVRASDQFLHDNPVMIPHQTPGKTCILNLSATAIRNFEIHEGVITYTTRFNGQAVNMRVMLVDVMYMYNPNDQDGLLIAVNAAVVAGHADPVTGAYQLGVNINVREEMMGGVREAGEGDQMNEVAPPAIAPNKGGHLKVVK